MTTQSNVCNCAVCGGTQCTCRGQNAASKPAACPCCGQACKCGASCRCGGK